MAAENQNVTMFAATRHVIQITCVDAAGNPKDINGDVITFTLLDYRGSETDILVLTGSQASPNPQIVFVDPSNGRVDVILLPGDTDNSLLGERAHEVETNNASGTDPQVSARGAVFIKYNAGAAGAASEPQVGVNSYVDREDATEYLRFSARAQAWLSLEPDVQNRSLIAAFRLIETARYAGVRTGGDSQTTQFPRDGIKNRDGIDQSGIAPAPQDVINAQIEYAFELSQDVGVETASGSGSNVKSVGAGSAKVAFFQPGRDAQGNRGTRFPLLVQRLLGPYLAGPSFGVTATGTDGESSFECEDRFGLSEGYK